MQDGLIGFLAGLVCFGLAVVAFLLRKEGHAWWPLSLALSVLGLEQFFSALAFSSGVVQEMLFWLRARFVVAAVVPAAWLTFVFRSGGENSDSRAPKLLVWVLWATFLVPAALATLGAESLFSGVPVSAPQKGFFLQLGKNGYYLQIVSILLATMMLMSLERILRQAAGEVRWQIKFLVLGAGGIFAFRLYSSVQAVLIRALDLGAESIYWLVVILCCGLMAVSLGRSRRLRIDFYLSPTLVFRSVVLAAVGGYLLAVGVLVQLSQYVQWSIPVQGLLVFAALVVLAVVLLSDRVHDSTRRLVSRHFRKPAYDYRRLWSDFTFRTATLVHIEPLSNELVKLVSETFQVLSVGLWLLPEGSRRMTLAASTTGRTQASAAVELSADELELLRQARGPEQCLIDLKKPESGNVAAAMLGAKIEDQFRSPVRYLVLLFSPQQMVGMLTLGERVRKNPFSVEECELLEVIGQQSAGLLLNLKLNRQLQESRQMEAFQNISTFLLHDLKNLASRLSLTVQNLPVHFENKDFRADALRTISHSVEKMKGMCGRLNALRDRLEIQPVKTDLNRLAAGVVSELNVGGVIRSELGLLPEVQVDREQFRKVVTNLLLNALEASPEGNSIVLSTRKLDGAVELRVADRGCGMSKEFVREKLFLPFQTTKPQGLGIGLYQSRMIVEKHGGRIEVESEVGLGSVFRVLLPSND